MGKHAERITLNMQDVLLKEVEKRVCQSPKQIVAFEDFKKKYASRCNTSNKMKELTYNMLPELLSMADMSLGDMYMLFGIKIEWPSEAAAKLCNILDAICDEDPAVMNKIKASAISFSPTFWHTSNVIELTPSRRATLILARKYGRAERRGENIKKKLPSLSKAWSDQQMCTTVNTQEFPVIAEHFGVSLRWLLGLYGSNVLTLARNADTEDVMDAYMFMSQTSKNIFAEAVRMIDIRLNDDVGGE